MNFTKIEAETKLMQTAANLADLATFGLFPEEFGRYVSIMLDEYLTNYNNDVVAKKKLFQNG